MVRIPGTLRLVFALVLTGTGASLLPVVSSSRADDGVDCISATLPGWFVQEACYRANYQHCLRRQQLGAPLNADCNLLLDNPPLPKGECTQDDHVNRRPGCAPPRPGD
jgi:hypothetical protein